MNDQENINRYDVVKVIEVPGAYQGLIDPGDIGVVVEKYDDETFEIECLTPDGSYKWLETLNRRYISKQLQSALYARKRSAEHLMRSSITFGSAIGAILGTILGAGLGAITRSLSGILIGLTIGLLLGVVTGACTAVLTVKIAGTTGGVGVGYYTGTLFGGVLGLVLGALIPPSLRMQAHTEGLPVLDALMMGRFETAILVGFVLSILATMVGVWVGGKNYVPPNGKQ